MQMLFWVLVDFTASHQQVALSDTKINHQAKCFVVLCESHTKLYETVSFFVSSV